MKKQDKAFFVFLTITNISFVVYYLMLAVFNRPSQDDWIFLKVINSLSSRDFLSHVYCHQSGRLAGYFLHTINYSIFNAENIAQAMPALSYILSVVLTYLTVRRVVNASKVTLVGLAFFIVNILIICNFEFSAFYWCCASLGIFGAVLYVYLFVLLMDFRNVWADKVQISLVTLFIALSSEVFTPLFAGLLFLAIVYRYIYCKSMKCLLANSGNRWIMAAILVLLIGTIVVVAAPGNYERAAEEIYVKPSSFTQFLAIWIGNFATYFYLLAFKFPYLLADATVMAFIGMKGAKFPINCSYKQLAICSSVLYIAFIVLSVFPMAYLMSGFGFQRFYTPCIYVGIVIIALHGWKLGDMYHKRLAGKLFPAFTSVCLLMVSSAMIFNLCYDTPIAKSYAESVDSRTYSILQHKNGGTNTPLELDKLADVHSINLKYLIVRSNKPVLYYSDDISTDPNSYSNMCISGFYELDFPIVLKQEKDAGTN